jgi:serine/threonine protein kinase
MKCPNCHSENKDGSKFCSHCAALLSVDETLPASPTKTLVTPPPTISKDALIAGKYRVIEEIGRGGMGIVYKAEDIRLKRTVALKFLPPHLMDSSELKERFLIEAQAAAALSHPNICVIHEVGEDDGRPYIAMEYVEGETLRDRIRKGPLESGEAMDLVDQIAAGLGEAHGKDIIHRDIKSANIMVSPKGRAKVMDFGLAKLRGGSSLTKSQTTLGTVAYMSPEQARGDQLDQRTDIWSLGVVLYELLAGKLPFRGDHDQTVIYSILHREPESLTKLRSGLAPELEHVVRQALAKKPSDRYQTMDEFAEDLAALTEGLKPLRAKARPDQPEKSIAVLPFINDSPDQENTYFINGVMEEILNNLQKIKDLRVISRTSVEQYREKKKPVREIAAELGVNYIVEGSAQKCGTAFRLRAQLIMAARETHLWGQSFQQKITEVEDIFNIQIQIAESIAAELKAVISPEEKQLIEKIPTADLTAYEAYLKGMSHLYKLTPPELDAALHYFEQTLEIDPNYALAYTGISFVWIGRQQMGLLIPSEATPKAKDAAQRALELDNTLAEVHYTWAIIRTWCDWDWEGAEQAFKRALELKPNYAEALVYYSNLLCYIGRLDEALEKSERAMQLDPLNSIILTISSNPFFYLRRWDDAIERCQNALQTSPNDPPAHNGLWELYYQKGMYEESLKSAKALFNGLGMAPIAEAMAQGYEEDGYSGAMTSAAKTMVEFSKQTYISPYSISKMYAFAGDKDNAMEWLEKGYEMRDPMMPYVSADTFDLLHDDPRYQDLLRRMNLPVDDKE